MIVEADRDFGQWRMVMGQVGEKLRLGRLSRNDLRAETGTLPPVEIFR